MAKRINRKLFKEEFLKNFSNYNELKFDSLKNNNIMFFADMEKCKQVTIEFISSKKYLYTIYVNADDKAVNDYIINYFKGLKLNKKYVIADRLNNVEVFC